MLKTVKKVLVIKLRDIGDIVLSTPVLNVLDDNCNAPEIVYVLKKEYEYFKYLLPNVKEVVTYDKNDPLDFLRVVFRLRRYRFDLAVNLHATFRSALITFFSGAKFRLVHNHSGKDYFTSVPLNINEGVKSIIERDLETLTPLKFNIKEEQKKTGLIINDDYARYIDDEDSANTIGFGTGAKRKNKKWPKEKFIELGKALSGRGHRIAVFCSPAEKKEGREIASGIGSGTRLYAGLDFMRLAFFINKLRLFVGNDSGLRHMAAALKVRTITIFGPENPLEWHPYFEKDGHIAVSRLDEFRAEGHDVLSKKFREKSMEPMRRISVREVLDACEKLIK